jgi:hypothetical protein
MKRTSSALALAFATAATAAIAASPLPVLADEAPAPCRDGQVKAHVGATGMNGDRHLATIVVTNASSAACTLDGYPRVSLMTKSGPSQDVPAARYAHATEVVVPPKGEASFAMQIATSDTKANACELQAFLPEGKTPLLEGGFTIDGCHTVTMLLVSAFASGLTPPATD